MECDKEIVVNCTTTIANLPPVQFELPIKVDTIVDACKSIPAGEPVVVDLLRKEDSSPKFVLIVPEIPDPKKVKFKGGDNGLQYNTTGTSHEESWKPIKKTHVFYDGMPEWMTDPPGDGSLQQLVFLSDFAPGDPPNDDEKKDGITALKSVKVRIIVGYETGASKDGGG